MQVHVLQLQGTGDDEYAYENAAVCANYEDAIERLAEINADYTDVDRACFKLNDNARIETHDLVDNNWGL
jgi:FKBP-type peptidyl-prolyl cis-trans isomerase (trigger factor)